MDLVLWVVLCILAAFGLIEAVRRVICRRRGARCGYYVVPLYGGAERAEALLRQSISRAGWSGGETMLILDMGADEESLVILEEMMIGSGLLYCKENRFFETVRRLDALAERTGRRKKKG